MVSVGSTENVGFLFSSENAYTIFRVPYFESHVCRKSRNSLQFSLLLSRLASFFRTTGTGESAFRVGSRFNARAQYSCDKKCLRAAIFSRGRNL